MTTLNQVSRVEAQLNFYGITAQSIGKEKYALLISEARNSVENAINQVVDEFCFQIGLGNYLIQNRNKEYYHPFVGWTSKKSEAFGFANEEEAATEVCFWQHVTPGCTVVPYA